MKKATIKTKAPAYSVAVFNSEGWFQFDCKHRHRTVDAACKCKSDHSTTILGQKGVVVNDETLKSVPND